MSFFAAARQAGFDAYLALVTHWEQGGAEGPDDFDSYHDDEDDFDEDLDDVDHEDPPQDDDEAAAKPSPYTMLDLIDSSLYASDFRDPHGRSRECNGYASPCGHARPQSRAR